MSPKETAQREEEVKAMLAEGASLSAIAQRYGITQQAVANFLNVRGWKTQEAQRRVGEASPEMAEKERLKAERKARRQTMKETVDRS
jgi:transposase